MTGGVPSGAGEQAALIALDRMDAILDESDPMEVLALRMLVHEARLAIEPPAPSSLPVADTRPVRWDVASAAFEESLGIEDDEYQRAPEPVPTAEDEPETKEHRDKQYAFVSRHCHRCGFRFDDSLHDPQEGVLFDHAFVDPPERVAEEGEAQAEPSDELKLAFNAWLTTQPAASAYIPDPFVPFNAGYRAAETALQEAREVLAQAEAALLKNLATWVTVEPLLGTPYEDDERWTPWTRFGLRAYEEAWKAHDAVKRALSTAETASEGETDGGEEAQ